MLLRIFVCEIRIHVYVLEVQLCVAVELGKEENFYEKTEGLNPAGNPASSWPDCWPDC